MKVFVITGPASSGKTTTIRHLEELGFSVMHEVAREVLTEKKLKPGTLEFQTEASNRHLAKELEIRAAKHDMVFLDRGLYDTTAYCKYFNLTLPDALGAKLHYDAVFTLEPLGNLEKDDVRIEKDYNEALVLGNLILEEYKTRNTPCVNVPVMSVKERAQFILNYIK